MSSVSNQVIPVCAAVEFWNAIVNWNIAEDGRFEELRRVFAKHLKLKDLMELMIKRVQSQDEESIYFLTLLFDSDEFVTRFLTDEMEETRMRCIELVISECMGLLTNLNLKENPVVLIFETLISVANCEKGRACLLTQHLKPFLELILKFVDTFERIVQIGASSRDDESEGSQGQRAKKLLGLVFRLYGSMHDESNLFLERLMEYFPGGEGGSRLRGHLQAFHADPLLRNNDMLETEDVDRFYLLFVSLKKRLRDQGVEEEARPVPILSRTAIERFKSITPGPFRVPFSLAMSVEFTEAFSSALDQALVQNVEGHSSELVMMVDDSDDEARVLGHGTHGESSDTGWRWPTDSSRVKKDEGGALGLQGTSDRGVGAGRGGSEMGSMGDTEVNRRAKRAADDSGEGTESQQKRPCLPRASSDEMEVNDASDRQEDQQQGLAGGEYTEKDGGPGALLEPDRTAEVKANDEESTADFCVSSPEFIDSADYDSDPNEDSLLPCKVIVPTKGELPTTLSDPADAQGKKEPHHLHFDFRKPRWSENAELTSSDGLKNSASTTDNVSTLGAQAVAPKARPDVEARSSSKAKNSMEVEPVAPTEIIYVDDLSDGSQSGDVMPGQSQHQGAISAGPPPLPQARQDLANKVKSGHGEQTNAGVGTGASARPHVHGRGQDGATLFLVGGVAPRPGIPPSPSISAKACTTQMSQPPSSRPAQHQQANPQHLARMYGGVRSSPQSNIEGIRQPGPGQIAQSQPAISSVNSRLPQTQQNRPNVGSHPHNHAAAWKLPGRRKNSRRHVDIAMMIHFMQRQREQTSKNLVAGRWARVQRYGQMGPGQHGGRGAGPPGMPGMPQHIATGHQLYANPNMYSAGRGQRYPQQAPAGQQGPLQYDPRSSQVRMQMMAHKQVPYQYGRGNPNPMGGNQGAAFPSGAGTRNLGLPTPGGLPRMYSAR